MVIFVICPMYIGLYCKLTSLMNINYFLTHWGSILALVPLNGSIIASAEILVRQCLILLSSDFSADKSDPVRRCGYGRMPPITQRFLLPESERYIYSFPPRHKCKHSLPQSFLTPGDNIKHCHQCGHHPHLQLRR